ncbi:MAG: adenylate/guanylate cyclase domain-containing protein [Ignavibacteria bacterium]|nr:adenylate/guanylate cyclase domain-containing protein [Ignavibacteria bacterium]
MHTTKLQTTKEWEQFLAGTLPGLRLGRSVFRLIPQAPRCKLCNAPFAGVGGRLMRLIGKVPWERNPRVCKFCGNWLLKKGPAGAEAELTLLFADVRGSTALAANMTPSEYAGVINRFFRVGTDVFVRYEAILDQLVGDEVIGLFLPGYAGADHARKAIEAACALLVATGHGPGRTPWIPIGVGVHTGLTFVGSVGSKDGFITDFTAIGDSVNTTARLASAAAAGEILVSEASSGAASLDVAELEERCLELKGIPEPVGARVLRSGPRFF